jgi:phosphatidylglycerol lysyltransferase
MRWRHTLGIKNREMTFLTRPAILDDEIDVRKFFAFNCNGKLQAFAFFDPIYDSGAIVGYLCSAKRRLPEADAMVGYAILKTAIGIFRDEGKRFLSLGLSPLCGIADKDLGFDRFVSFGFRLVYNNRLFNKFIYPLQGIAEHKGSFGGSSELAYCAFKGGCALTRLLTMPRACNLI